MLRSVSTTIETLVRKSDLERLSGEPVGSDILIVGGAGCGKTVLLNLLANLEPKARPSIVDASSPANRTRLGLATACIGLPSAGANQFLNYAAKARVDGTHKATADALKAFMSCLPELAATQGSIYIDNLDRAPDQAISWLATVVREFSGPRIVAAAQSDQDIPDHFRRFFISRLTRPQIEVLIAAWTDGYGIPQPDLASYVDSVCEGNAVLAALATWAALRTGIQNGWSAFSLQELIVEAVRSMSDASRAAWMSVIVAKHRITEEIVQALSGDKAAQHFRTEIAEIPILRRVAVPLDGVALHSVARQRIASALTISEPEKHRIMTELIRNVYPRLISTELDPAANARMQLERLQYLMDLDVEEGTSHLERVFNEALLRGNIAWAEELAQVAEVVQESTEGSVSLRLKLLSAECDLLLHRSDKAFSVLGSISVRRLMRESSDLRTRHSLLKARCATSPSPSRHTTIFEAVTLLEGGLLTSSDSQGGELRDQAMFELAEALQLVARNRESAELYLKIANNSPNEALRIRSLEELSCLYRDMQRLDDAASAIQAANEIRFEQGLVAGGISTYYLANLCRDRDEFHRAEGLYRQAEGQFIDADDIHQLCCLYGDFAWMKFLANDIPSSRGLLEKYRALATTYNFGRELSEYWHIEYHLAMQNGDEKRALSSLSTALDLAFKYGNVYMQLDCLMHKVQAMVRAGDIDSATALVCQMQEIEEKGAEINVFRGRAIVALGDGYFSAGQEGEAYANWSKGFEIVARFGNSRTNVELLGDLLAPRIDRFRDMESRLSLPPWPHEALLRNLPSLRIAIGQGEL